MAELTKANDLTGLIDNQNKLLEIVNNKIEAWDAKADGEAFTKLSSYIDINNSSINGNLTITKTGADTEVSIIADDGHSAVLTIDNKLKISSNVEIDRDALTSSQAFSLTSSNKISINTVIDAYTDHINVIAPLNITKKTTINNLILEDSTISLTDASTILKLQSSIKDYDGAYIVLTNKDFSGKPPYYDYRSSSFHVITNPDNTPSVSIYNDKSAKFYDKVSIPYLEISNVEGSYLTFKATNNNDWAITATEKSLTFQSVNNSEPGISTAGTDIIAFERNLLAGSYSSNIAKVHFGQTYIPPSGSSSSASDYEITFDFSDTNPAMRIKGNKVVGTRQIGWTSSTTTSDVSKDLNTIKSGTTLTVEALAKVVRALVNDMFIHGLIGDGK